MIPPARDKMPPPVCNAYDTFLFGFSIFVEHAEQALTKRPRPVSGRRSKGVNNALAQLRGSVPNFVSAYIHACQTPGSI